MVTRNGYEMSFPLHQQWPTESFERFTLMYDGIIEFHFELCKTNEQNANTRDAHLFYGTRILPDSIENNRWIQINRKEIGHKPDTSQMKKRPICIGVFESTGNQIDWISQFSQFQQYLNILRCVWIGTGSFLRSELNWKCKLSTWLLKYTVRWKYCLVQASSRYLVGDGSLGGVQW